MTDNLRKQISLIVLSLAVAINIIDGTVLNVSIPYIITDLNTDFQNLQWAITSYSLIIASLTIFGGRLGDIFGRKRMFIVGGIIFAIGSLITAFSKDFNSLWIGWSLIEGIGSALMIPASSALVVSNFEGKERGRAFAIYGATAGASAAFGPILGGFLTTNFTWRWAFGINLFVVALLVAGSYFVKDYKPEKVKKVNLDFIGVLLSALGLGSLMYGIIETSTYGWFTAKKAFDFNGQSYDLAGISVAFWFILTGIILTTLFILWERYQEKQGNNPLISTSIFSNRAFTIGVAVQTILFAGFTGLITYSLSLFYQIVLGLGAFDSGIGILPISLGVMLMAPISARLAEKVGVKLLVQIGLVLSVIGSILLYTELTLDANRLTFIPGLLVFGIGFGLIVAQLTNLILSSVTNEQAGQASSLNATIREVGRAFGSALIGAVFIATFASSFTNQINKESEIPDQIKTPLVERINSGDNNQVFNRNQTQENSANPFSSKIDKAFKESFVDGSRQAIVYTGGFALLALIVSLALPSDRKKQLD